MNNAIAFKIKITPSDIAISWSFAFRTGPTAAMALPPHIAVLWAQKRSVQCGYSALSS